MGTKSFSFGSEEFSNVLKVFMWTVASAVVALITNWVGLVEIPAQYAFVVPLVNTVLYALKEWVADNRFN